MKKKLTENGSDDSLLIEEAAAGNQRALNELFERDRVRLKKMVRMRLNSRLQGRVDDSDVLQEAYLDAARRLPEYLEKSDAPFFLWLRLIVSRKLIDVHRQHLGAHARDARLEVRLHRSPMPMASSISMADQLIGHVTSPSQAAIKAERRVALQEALEQLSDKDREILSMRNYEDMSNQETACELGIEESAASKRYLRALERLQKTLVELGVVE